MLSVAREAGRGYSPFGVFSAIGELIRYLFRAGNSTRASQGGMKVLQCCDCYNRFVAERWQSGRLRRSRKPLNLYGFREFESPPLRHADFQTSTSGDFSSTVEAWRFALVAGLKSKASSAPSVEPHRQHRRESPRAPLVLRLRPRLTRLRRPPQQDLRRMSRRPCVTCWAFSPAFFFW
jgi:hypothetical protein